MTPERLKRAEEVFFRAAPLGGPERERALNEACGTDAALRRDVEELLAHSEALDGFLDTPALGLEFSVVPDAIPDENAGDELIGRVVGRYRVMERLASGGMGTVYLAERDDPQVGGLVAMKVVKRGMDSEEILRRFRQERRTLGGLEHPNIARLLDGGATNDGRPYLVMEFVRGEAIDLYCERHGLGVAERLRLFLRACDAVAFAHQALIVHRDLKPANILVDERATPKLLDFGIAKVLGGTGSADVTAAPERRLTPEYASPEQIAGRPVTTAADVYSLGVVLYELLSGRRPYRFETRTTHEIERVIVGTEPPAPSQAVLRADTPQTRTRPPVEPPDRLARTLRGDLDTIVQTAMRKDPERRYPSVERLADDVRHYLGGMPISARRDTLGYRASKFVARHRVGVGTAIVIFVAGAAGVAALVRQGQIAARERDAAFVARDQAEAIAAFLRGMLGSANPADMGPSVTVREVLDEAAARLDAQLRDQPLIAASVRSTIGVTYADLGLLDQAERQLTTAHDQRLALLGSGHHDTAESRVDLATLRYRQGRFAEAEGLLREALRTFLTIRGDHNPDIARVKSSLGAVVRAQGRLDEAATLHREALEIRRAYSGPESLDVAESLNNLAGALRLMNRPDDAEAALSEALRIRRALLGQGHALVVQSTDNLAVLVHQRGDLERAEPLYREALDAARAALGNAHPDVAITLSNLGALLLQARRGEEAVAVLREALDIRLGHFDEDDPRVMITRLRLASALGLAGNPDQAATVMAPAVEHALDPAQDPRTRDAVLDCAAETFETLGRPERAAEMRSKKSAPE